MTVSNIFKYGKNEIQSADLIEDMKPGWSRGFDADGPLPGTKLVGVKLVQAALRNATEDFIKTKDNRPIFGDKV